MARYADIDKAMELAARTMVNGSQVAYVVMGLPNFVENILNNAEVEAEPVKHGHWVKKWHAMFRRELPMCSECGDIWVVKTNYCPNCGAKMDLDEAEE